MRKLVIILVALLVVCGLAFAAGPSGSGMTLVPWVDKGSLIVNADIGWGLTAGAEYDFARINIANVVPITFGAAARVSWDPGLLLDYSSFGLGALVTAHVGLKSVSLPSGLSWASHFDFYAGLGLGIGSLSLAGYTFPLGFGISTFEGTSYYFNDKFALNLEYGYLGRSTDNTGYYTYSVYYWGVGAVLKL
jgi:hypothetical protein